jgi:hypothetical protein
VYALETEVIRDAGDIAFSVGEHGLRKTILEGYISGEDTSSETVPWKTAPRRRISLWIVSRRERASLRRFARG